MHNILLTGLPRSSTSLLGRVMGSCEGVSNVYEPFNHVTGFCGVQQYFHHEDQSNFNILERCLPQEVRGLLDLRYSNLAFFPEDSTPKRLAKVVLGNRTRWSVWRSKYLNASKDGPFIVKDPFASFIANFLAEKWDMKILFCLRNPYVLASSFKKHQWFFPLCHLEPHFPEVFASLEKYVSPSKDMSDSCICALILWLCADEYYECRLKRNAVILNTEYLLTEPLDTYDSILSSFNLIPTPHTREIIRKAVSGVSTSAKGIHDSSRTLESINNAWKRTLDDGEKEMVRDLAREKWQKWSQREALHELNPA